ncbi:MAG: NAD(+) diphosphatase [Candidatus Dormibacteraeota bacterium]|nr:NAD(+) diphosphatase [Candidatus Dormibacteraeota bacterium]
MGFLAEIDLEAQPDDRALVFAFHEGRLLVARKADLAEPVTFGSVASVLGGAIARIYLGRLDGRPCFAIPLATEPETPPGFVFLGLRELFGQLEEPIHGVAGRASQIVEWYLGHAFCGRCGSQTELAAGERARGCPNCGATYFPRINPAVIMLVERHGKMLLARNKLFRGPWYSCLAGFVEPGESLEEAVAREVLEEVGIEVDGITYAASQPWPFPSQLMIGFYARHRSGEIKAQDSEILDAAWFSRDELPQMPGRFSLARQLIDGFLDGGPKSPSLQPRAARRAST